MALPQAHARYNIVALPPSMEPGPLQYGDVEVYGDSGARKGACLAVVVCYQALLLHISLLLVKISDLTGYSSSRGYYCILWSPGLR